MMRRILCCVLIVVAVTMVAGCGGRAPAGSAPAAREKAAERPTVAQAAQARPTARPTVVPPTAKPAAEVAQAKAAVVPTRTPLPKPPALPTAAPAAGGEAKQSPPRLQTAQAKASQGEQAAPAGGGQAMSGFLDLFQNTDTSTALDALDAEFDTYRMHGTLHTDTNGQVSDQEYWVEVVREPQAMRIVANISVEGSDPVSTEVIIIGDTMYIKAGDRWMATTTEGEALSQVPSGIGALGLAPKASELQSCQDLGVATVNGMATQHYRCDSGQGVWYAAEDGSGSLGGVIEVWISTELNAVVKTAGQMTLQGSDQSTRIDLVAEYSDINAAITIAPPAGVSAPEVPADVPVMDGASQVVVVESMLSYIVEATPQQVADFYLAQMPANGWTYRQNMSRPPDMMGFNKGQRVANVMAGAQGDKTSVTIMVIGQ